MIRQGIVDKTTGLVVAEAVLAAVIVQIRTGRGTRLDVSMLDVALHLLWPDGMMNHTCLDEVDQLPSIASSFRLTTTADGEVSIVCLTTDQIQGLLAACNLSGLYEELDLHSPVGRARNGGRMMSEVVSVLGRLSTDEVVRLLHAHDVPCAPALSLDAVPDHPHVKETGSLVETTHPVLGRIVQPNPPARFEGEVTVSHRSAPDLGVDADSVLGDYGFSPPEIEELKASGAVLQPTR